MISTKNGESKKHSGAKVKKHAAELIVGKDIMLSEVPQYLSLALVGIFCGKIVSKNALRRWMEENWNPHLRQLPMFHILLRVKIEVERQLLLRKNWQWGPSKLILKNWSIEFDVNREPRNVQKILAILPGLPMMF